MNLVPLPDDEPVEVRRRVGSVLAARLHEAGWFCDVEPERGRLRTDAPVDVLHAARAAAFDECGVPYRLVPVAEFDAEMLRRRGPLPGPPEVFDHRMVT